MALAGFISKIVQSITRTTFQFNKTLDVLISQFKDACPTTEELKSLINQKNQINGALVQIEGKIATLNKVAAGSEIAVEALSAGKTIIKQLPIPSSVPPGIGLPLSVTNNFSDALDNLGTLIDKEEASLESIPEALELISKDVGEVITKLNELDVVLNNCLEKDPNITQADLDDIVATTGNFVGVLTNEQLEEILNNPPGLLYGDYYLRLNYVEVSQATLSAFNEDIAEGEGELLNATSIGTATLTNRSFDKKQVTAQNKESVPPPGDFYNENIAVEILYGDESFSSSNIVLVDEMKWLIDTKDLIFLPPPPQEDPLKAIYKENQVILLMSLFGANREEAEEIYELAWELSQNKGPNKGYYDTLVKEAFDNSRTILEQAVANEGYEWKEGDRVLDSTIKKLFLPNITDEIKIKSNISLLRRKGVNLEKQANSLGGNYNTTDKRWNNDGEFNFTPNAKLYPYSERLALTAENLFNDATIGSSFIGLRSEMKRRKSLWQAIFEEANYISLTNPDVSFNDPLKEYFSSKGMGYNTPSVNGIPIVGNSSTPITFEEGEELYDREKDINAEWFFNNSNLNDTPQITPNGVTFEMLNAYSKTQLMIKLKTALGNGWYNQSAITTSELPFWAPSGGNPNDSTYYQGKDPNYGLNPSDKWYFEFGRNGLPIPTGS
tara:strand:+ start:286 stop:2286 length:2001 start_codon:yes stop_codon:yes gene_type:complete